LSSGVRHAIAAHGFWGLTPLYWKAVEVVPPPKILHGLGLLRARGSGPAPPAASDR
jgi:hypothetical protein